MTALQNCTMNVETLGKELLNHLGDKKHLVKSWIPKCFLTQNKSSQDKCTEAKQWLDWAERRNNIRVARSPVPPGILPVGCHGELCDVKVQSRGPDDAIYDAHKDIRDKVARGNTFLELTREGRSETKCVIYALKKFTGGLGDDDDRDQGDNHTWKRYFTKPLESTKEVVCTRKANGEAAHLSTCRIGGKFIICCGSKNVHMLMKDRGDLGLYTDGRYRVACEVAEAVWDLLESLEEAALQRLLWFLHLSESTAVFEVLQPTYQHVEDLSHLKRPELRFITWTSNDVSASADSSLCSLPPHIAIELASCLGLSPITYTVIDFKSVDSHMANIRRGYGYEGEVLYFLDEDSNVIGLLKKKTVWYIICRAIREKVRTACGLYNKKPSDSIIGSSRRKIEGRIEDIQKWLNIDDEATQSWKDLGVGFLKWTISKLKLGEVNFKEVAELFPVVWKKYLLEMNQSDKIPVKSDEEHAQVLDAACGVENLTVN